MSWSRKSSVAKIAMGTKLREEVLAARFGVSRGPLREAFETARGARAG